MGFLDQLRDALGLGETTPRHQDVRGWIVTDDAGNQLGTMDDWLYDRDSSQIRYGIVNVENRRVLVPVGDLDFDDTRRLVIARGYDKSRLIGLRAYDPSTWNEETERAHYGEHVGETRTGDQLDYGHERFRGKLPERIRLMEEQLRIGKRPVQTGEVTVGKRPVTEEVNQDVQLQEERIEINRTPVNRPVEGEMPIADRPETVNVPLYKEEVQVEKTPVIREEVEINKVADTRTETVNDQIKREELVTEGLDQANRREGEFVAAEPTEEELRRRRLADTQVDVTPIEDTSDINRPI